MSTQPISDFAFLAKTAAFVLRRRKLKRATTEVAQEYSQGWEDYGRYLERAETVDDWLRVRGVEDREDFFQVDGRLSYQAFDSAAFYRSSLLRLLLQSFPQVHSVTEFGCGVGRNLLYLKQQNPDLAVQGYELCVPGVEAGRAAARKFGFDVAYEQLDYLNDPPQKYVHPESDVAFTMFSLEQLPEGCDKALRNILSRVRLGSIHIEPVPENYPWTMRGVLGRIDHWKVGYLSGFDRAVRSLDLAGIEVHRLASAHNPLMFPSAYVLRKRPA
jgi:hypothetical protein